MAFIEKYFQLKAHGTTPRREIIAGLTTFAAMAYILVVNPAILADGTGMDEAGLVTVTALAAAIGCFLMAAMTNLPMALAPGMGINAYFSIVVVTGMGVPWQSALGLVFWNGILFFILSVTGVRRQIVTALPAAIRVGVQCGIGFFIAFIGLQQSGIIVNSPATMVTEGDLLQPGPVMTIVGLLAMAILTLRRVPGSILGTILVLTFVGLWVSVGTGTMTSHISSVVALPASPAQTILALDFFYLFREPIAALPVVMTLLLVDMFDTLGTLVGLGRQAGMMDDKGHMPKINRALTADALATIAGTLLGTSTTTTYIESATGIEAGGRTGLTPVVVGLCFLLSLFFAPLITAIPAAATAPALIFVGVLMASGLREIDYGDLGESVPAVLTVLLIPLTFSISQGLFIGLIVYVAMALMLGRRERLSVGACVLAVLFVLFLVWQH